MTELSSAASEELSMEEIAAVAGGTGLVGSTGGRDSGYLGSGT